MAAPSEKTLENLAGKWKLNKNLSSNISPTLELQGVNFLMRKGISAAPITIAIKQPEKDRIEVAQSVSAASIPGTTEHYQLDWEWRENKDPFFGGMKGRARWIEKSEIDEGNKDGKWDDEKLIQAVSEKVDGSWKAVHVWGFEEIAGERKQTRRVVTTDKNGKAEKVIMVYDWAG